MGLPLPHNATVFALILRIGLPALGVCLGCAPRLALAQDFCQSCEVQAGLGGTYHYWGTTGSLVLPVSLTWSDDRYELAAFRFTDQQESRRTAIRSIQHRRRSCREVAKHLFSAGGSRAANGDEAVLRASCRSNLYEPAHLPAIRTVLFLILLSRLR